MSNYIGYKKVDNLKRKANNTGEEITTIGVHKNVKEYTNPNGTYYEQAERITMESVKKSRKMPVKIYTEEEKKALQAQLNPEPVKPKTQPYKRPVEFMNDEQSKEWEKKFPNPVVESEASMEQLVGEFFKDENGDIYRLEGYCAQPTATFVKIGTGERKSGAVGSLLLGGLKHINDPQAQELLGKMLDQVVKSEE